MNGISSSMKMNSSQVLRPQVPSRLISMSCDGKRECELPFLDDVVSDDEISVDER